MNKFQVYSNYYKEATANIKSKRLLGTQLRPTGKRAAHTLALHMEADDSGLGWCVLVGGCAASILLRKNQQLRITFLGWTMELLILNDLN